MIDNNKRKDIVQGVIIMVIISSLFGWLWEKPKEPIRWGYVILFVVLVGSLIGVVNVGIENKRIKDLIEKTTKDCPTCKVMDGYPNYKCIYNCD